MTVRGPEYHKHASSPEHVSSWYIDAIIIGVSITVNIKLAQLN